MNKKQKQERKTPDWLINLVIKTRVMRWRLVDGLKDWSAKEKPWRLRLYFILFTTIGGAGCSLLLVHALQPHRPEKTWLMLRQEVETIQHYRKGDSLTDIRQVGENDNFYWQLIDSIRKDSNLKRSIDSLLTAQPGFADTLRQLEQMHPGTIR